MKRKYGNRSNWKRILKREYAQTYLETGSFKGYITLLKMNKVREPLHVKYADKDLCIVNDGYMWLQHFPADQHHAVTTMFDGNGQIIQWYIDICYQNGVGEDHVPWMDDLYLDIVVLPSEEVILKDADELDEALLHGAIDYTLYDLAKREASRLTSLIHNHSFQLLKLSHNHKELLVSKLSGNG